MTGTVSFQAEAFLIVANGQCFTARDTPVQVHSDPGWGSYTTLELKWTEHGRDMRLFIYFTADSSGWRTKELRTFDGTVETDWLFYYGDYFVTPIGQTFHGDLDLKNNAKDPVRGELHLHGLTISTTLTGRSRGGS